MLSTNRILRSERKLEDRFVLAGALILVCIGVFAFAADGRIGRLAVVALEGLTLLVILRASHAQPRTIRLVGVAVLVSVGAVALSFTASGRYALAAPGVLGAALALCGPIAIVHRLREQDTIEFTTVAGALCIYLLAGLFFALAFWSIGAIEHSEFFVQQPGGTGVDYVYYSFTTLTTVGFGDLTARHDFGRISSILESLFGQLYLVSVVALLVANLGRNRRSP